jgi:ketosteroid isomerase-like protein
MIDRAEYEHLLDELHAARIDGPLERLCAVFAPDVQFRIAGASDGKPIAINAQGSDAVRPWLAMLLKTFRLSDYRLLSRVIDDHRAAVHWSADIHSKITGSRVRTELVDMIEIRDLRITSYTEFFVPR